MKISLKPVWRVALGTSSSSPSTTPHPGTYCFLKPSIVTGVCFLASSGGGCPSWMKVLAGICSLDDLEDILPRSGRVLLLEKMAENC